MLCLLHLHILEEELSEVSEDVLLRLFLLSDIFVVLSKHSAKQTMSFPCQILLAPIDVFDLDLLTNVWHNLQSILLLRCKN